MSGGTTAGALAGLGMLAGALGALAGLGAFTFGGGAGGRTMVLVEASVTSTRVEQNAIQSGAHPIARGAGLN
jgi:hypothetical protein